MQTTHVWLTMGHGLVIRVTINGHIIHRVELILIISGPRSVLGKVLETTAPQFNSHLLQKIFDGTKS